jgi:hypothetical protein
LSLRSPALAALGALLLASAAALGVLLVHDGEAATGPRLAEAEPGEDVRLKGEPAPFVPPPGSLRQWRPLLPMLGNHTYALEQDGALVLLASAAPAPAGVVLAEGTVDWVGPHPGGSGGLVVVVRVHGWTQPLVFR